MVIGKRMKVRGDFCRLGDVYDLEFDVKVWQGRRERLDGDVVECVSD
jgi:hypothetical protein